MQFWISVDYFTVSIYTFLAVTDLFLYLFVGIWTWDVFNFIWWCIFYIRLLFCSFFICLFVFAFPRFQAGVVAVCSLAEDSSVILPDAATGFLGESVSRYWELIISDGDRLRKGVSAPPEGREIKCSTRIWLVPWVWGKIVKRP